MQYYLRPIFFTTRETFANQFTAVDIDYRQAVYAAENDLDRNIVNSFPDYATSQINAIKTLASQWGIAPTSGSTADSIAMIQASANFHASNLSVYQQHLANANTLLKTKSQSDHKAEREYGLQSVTAVTDATTSITDSLATYGKTGNSLDATYIREATAKDTAVTTAIAQSMRAAKLAAITTPLNTRFDDLADALDDIPSSQWPLSYGMPDLGEPLPPERKWDGGSYAILPPSHFLHLLD